MYWRSGDGGLKLALSGPSGGGKSMIAEMLGRYKDVLLVRESLPKELFDAFSRSPVKFCYDLQRAIVASRLSNFKSAPNATIRVLHRTIEEDREVFFVLHKRLGFLDEEQFEQLNQFSRECESQIGKPDAVVFVTAKPSVLRKRMLSKGLPALLVESVELQHSLYETWRSGIKVPVAVVDNTELSINGLEHVANWIYQTAPRLSQGPVSKCQHPSVEWVIPGRKV